MDGIIAYALLKKRITSALSGIADISLDGNQTIVFETNDGEQFKIKIPTPELIYVGPEEPDADSEYELWIDTDDEGTTALNKAIISEAIVATTVIGSVTSGKVYPVGTSIEQILRDILTSYSKPTVSVTTVPITEIYDAVTDTLSKIDITGKIVKGTENIAKISFYIDDTLLEEKEGSTIKDGGTFTVSKDFSPATNKTFVCKVSANDGKNTVNGTKTIIFIGKTYYGVVPETIIIPTESDIKGLQNNVLKNSRVFNYKDIPIPQDGNLYKVLYSYPKSLGKITKIVDADGRDYTASYTESELKVDGIDYYAYILTDGTGTDGATQKFS